MDYQAAMGSCGWTYRVLAGMRWVPVLIVAVFLALLVWLVASGSWRNQQPAIPILAIGILGGMVLWVICSVGMAVLAGAHALMSESIARQVGRRHQELSRQPANGATANSLDDQIEREKRFFSRG